MGDVRMCTGDLWWGGLELFHGTESSLLISSSIAPLGGRSEGPAIAIPSLVVRESFPPPHRLCPSPCSPHSVSTLSPGGSMPMSLFSTPWPWPTSTQHHVFRSLSRPNLLISSISVV